MEGHTTPMQEYQLMIHCMILPYITRDESAVIWEYYNSVVLQLRF